MLISSCYASLVLRLRLPVSVFSSLLSLFCISSEFFKNLCFC